MPPPAKRHKKGRRLARIARFAKDAPPYGNGGIGTKHDILRPGLYGLGLLARDPLAIWTGKLAFSGVFVDIRRANLVRHNTDLRKQFPAARTAGAEDKCHAIGPVINRATGALSAYLKR